MLAGFFYVGRQLHATRLAATTDFDLRLDDDRVADALGDRDRLFDGVGDVAGRDGDAVAREVLLALILKEVHSHLLSGWGNYCFAT